MTVAIVGMACMFPGAPDLAAFWHNLQHNADAIRDVPSERIDPLFFAAEASARERFYCKRGGFIDDYALFDAPQHGVMPVAVEGADPDQLLTLQIASAALADAGYARRAFARERTAVILGRGGYAGAGYARLDQHVRGVEQLLVTLRELLPNIDAATLARVRREFSLQLRAAGPDAAIGLVPNLTASRIAHRLDLGGPAFTVDAACASALIAVEQGVRELSAGRCDMVVVGGVHLNHQELFWSVFSQLGALSRSGQIRPFDRRADGLLIGEGIGVLVLRRLADAERDGDRIYAVIRGVGSASDGRVASLLSPSVDGQASALERAWRDAAYDPSTVGLVEAHGTGTVAGDAAELQTLARVFGAARSQRRSVLGSVKSLIGHTMPAAGAAGLIKAALAVHHGVLLPTLHCEEPSALLEATRFRVIERAEPWEELPRRAGVSAFGFGGINAHVVLEGHATARNPRTAPPMAADGERLWLFSAQTVPALLEALTQRQQRLDGGPVRLAISDPTPERVQRAQQIVRRGQAWPGRSGIWFSTRGALHDGAGVVGIFPGVDAVFEPRVADLASHFDLALPAHLDAQGIAETSLGIMGVNRLVFHALQQVGVTFDHVAGHSLGEWSAMIAAGVLPESRIEDVLAHFSTDEFRVPGVVFAALGAGVDTVRAAIADLDGLEISHDNCPHQTIVCGREPAVDLALARLAAQGVIGQKLPFQSGFHCSFFADYVEPLRRALGPDRAPARPARTPLWSATTVARYPDEPDAIMDLTVRHLLEPVRFRELIEALYAAGVRAFVQVGTGHLVHFIDDTLRGRPHLAVAANVRERSGLAQLRRTMAALFVAGHDGLAFERVLGGSLADPVRLSLGIPLVRKLAPLPAAHDLQLTLSTEIETHPLAREFRAASTAVNDAQRAVFAQLAALPTRDRPPREWSVTRRLSVQELPELLDHAFYKQRPGWPEVADTFPLLPLTALIDLAIEIATAGARDRVAIAVEDVRAYRWLAVVPAVEVTISCRREAVAPPAHAAHHDEHHPLERIHVRFGEYTQCVVVLARAYPPPPAANHQALAGPRDTITPEELYAKRWMFHGPAYRGIVALGPIGENGLQGRIRAGAARGALLDAAGQMFGYWGMQRTETDRLMLPIAVAKIAFYGPPPQPGELLACTMRVDEYQAKSVIGELELVHAGQLWARLSRWEDRRFESDTPFWAVLTQPERARLSEPLARHVALYRDHYRSAPARDQLSRVFLTQTERAEYERQGPRKQRLWLNGRVAAKDALRWLLLEREAEPRFPAELQLTGDATQDIRVRIWNAPERALHVAVAHHGDLAVAIAADGETPGIALVPLSDAQPDAFSPAEWQLVANEPPALGVALLAAARTAARQTTRDTTAPQVRDRRHERLLVGSRWIATRVVDDCVLAWTVLREGEP